jgi:cation diffusion facilitator family transporter
MSDCGCHVETPDTPAERRILWIALALNALMAVVGGIAGWFGESTGLLADALDMLSDATAYAIGLVAIGRSATFKVNAARVSGTVLLLLGMGVLVEVGRRAFYGSEPVSVLMLAVASLSLLVNVIVLRLLRPLRQGEVHLRATWIFTRADLVANVGVIASAALILLTGSRFPDLIVGAVIGLYVVREAVEILKDAHGEDGREK